MQVVLHDWYSSHLLHASDVVIWNCVTLTLEATKSTQVEIQQKVLKMVRPLQCTSAFSLVHWEYILSSIWYISNRFCIITAAAINSEKHQTHTYTLVYHYCWCWALPAFSEPAMCRVSCSDTVHHCKHFLRCCEVNIERSAPIWTNRSHLINKNKSKFMLDTCVKKWHDYKKDSKFVWSNPYKTLQLFNYSCSSKALVAERESSPPPPHTHTHMNTITHKQSYTHAHRAVKLCTNIH